MFSSPILSDSSGKQRLSLILSAFSTPSQLLPEALGQSISYLLAFVFCPPQPLCCNLLTSSPSWLPLPLSPWLGALGSILRDDLKSELPAATVEQPARLFSFIPNVSERSCVIM